MVMFWAEMSYLGRRVQQSPDNHTMLNHTTLLFAPNLPRIKRNVNKFALIMAQKSPDNRTKSVKVSSFTAFIHQLLQAWKYCLWLWRFQRPFASVSIIWFWIPEELTTSILRPICKVVKEKYHFLTFQSIYLQFWPSYSVGKILIPFNIQGCCKEVFSSPYHWNAIFG